MAYVRNANFPDFDLEWATNASTQIEPSAAEKATGYQLADQPAAKKLNWLLDAPMKALKVAFGGAFGRYRVQEPISAWAANTIGAITYSEYYDRWVAFSSTMGPTIGYQSIDGLEWVATGGGLASAVYFHCAGSDTSGRIMAMSSTGTSIYYNTTLNPATPFTTVWTGITPGGTDYCMRVKTGTDNVMFCNSAYFAYASDVTALPVTPVATPETIRDITDSGQGDSTWYALASSGKIYTSTDDGSTWNLTGDAALVFPTYAFRSIDIDPVSGKLCVACYDFAGGPPYTQRIAYSSDVGVTWTAASVPSFWDGPTVPETPRVRNLGGQIWVAYGRRFYDGYIPEVPNICFSIDGGVTWQQSIRDDSAVENTGTVASPFCCVEFDGRFCLFGGGQSTLIRTGAVVV